MSLVVSLTVVTDDQAVATRSAEALARVATGLALEGVQVSLSLATVEDDPADPVDPQDTAGPDP